MKIPGGTSASVQLAGRKLYVAVPTYDGKLPVEWIRSFIETTRIAAQYNVEVYLHTLSYCALIDKARDQLVRDFLIDTDATDFLFIDSDIIWRDFDVLNMLFNVNRCGMVVGPYCAKEEEPTFHYTFYQNEEGKVVQDEYGLFRLRYAPTGFMMMNREVLQKMWDKYKHTLKYIGSNFDKFPNGLTAYDLDIDDFKDGCQVGLFQTMLEDGHYKGEDIAFCHRWTAEMGGELWIDPDIKLKHIGRKEYDHDFVQYISRRI